MYQEPTNHGFLLCPPKEAASVPRSTPKIPPKLKIAQQDPVASETTNAAHLARAALQTLNLNLAGSALLSMT